VEEMVELYRVSVSQALGIASQQNWCCKVGRAMDRPCSRDSNYEAVGARRKMQKLRSKDSLWVCWP
jgi:hypothetical protein